MPATSVEQAILATLAFFSIYQIPVSKDRIYHLLYRSQAGYPEFETALKHLVAAKQIQSHEGLFSLRPEDLYPPAQRKLAIQQQWRKIDRYFWLLYLLPFVRHLSVINSLAIGNTNDKSDIDFFVITRSGLLYTTRSLVIVILKLFGLYKTRQKIKDRFCLGFYVDEKRLNLADILIPGGDPLFAFWFASFAPLYGGQLYEEFASQNQWVTEYLPNFDPQYNLKSLHRPSKLLTVIKIAIEVLLFVPAILIEPLARFVHIRHTNNLPENHWPTSTTRAEKDLLKLHAADPRLKFREDFYLKLEKFQ